jgi:hypothetical protein
MVLGAHKDLVEIVYGLGYKCMGLSLLMRKGVDFVSKKVKV